MVLNAWFKPSTAPAVPTAPLKGKRQRSGKCIAVLFLSRGHRLNLVIESISVSSHSSEASNEGSDYTPGDTAAMGGEETDSDGIKLIEKPVKKRPRGMCPNLALTNSYINGIYPVLSPEIQELSRPEFIQGSSRSREPNTSARDTELNSLAQWLDRSASFEESNIGNVWVDTENAELEEGCSDSVWLDKNTEQYSTF